jgi:hypothetical protein
MTDSTEDPTAHARWLEQEIARQRSYLESVDRDRGRAPFLLLGFVVAIPVGIFYGWIKALLVCLGTVALLLSIYYLTAMHRSQYLHKIAGLENDLREVQRTLPRR